MGTVFKERFPESEIITADFVDYANELVALREKTAAAATANNDGAGATADYKEKEKAGRIGTVVFNAVFGNLWDQGVALECAATIIEVILEGITCS